MSDPRWALLTEMEPALLEAFVSWGVVRIEYVAAFPDVDGAWVWLGTATDAERDAVLRREAQALVRVRSVAEAHGLPPSEVRGVTSQSEETVARDHDGRWSNALR